jgi:hypothetical protein
LLAQVEEMETRLQALETEKAAQPNKAGKDKVQKKIRNLKKERDAIQAQAALL